MAQHSVRVLGLDLLSADNAAALLQQVDGAETGSSPEAMADFLSGVRYSSNLGEAVREQLNREVNGYLAIDDLIIADIAVAQEILGWDKAAGSATSVLISSLPPQSRRSGWKGLLRAPVRVCPRSPHRS